MDPRLQQNRRAFLSEQNESMLYGMLAKNFQQRLGSQLNEKQSSYLERTLEYYMGEVIQANPSVPVQTLNKEVLSATASEFNDYLQRGVAVSSASQQTFQDASQRFEQAQQERGSSRVAHRATQTASQKCLHERWQQKVPWKGGGGGASSRCSWLGCSLL